jgi:hypothetical protein
MEAPMYNEGGWIPTAGVPVRLHPDDGTWACVRDHPVRDPLGTGEYR